MKFNRQSLLTCDTYGLTGFGSDLPFRFSVGKMLALEVLWIAMAWQSKERRIKARFRVAMPVVLQTPTGELHVETHDIGPCGAFVRSATAIPLGSKVKMTFTVPGRDAFPDNFPFYCDGTVVRLERLADDNWGIAVACKFIEEG